MVGRTLPLAVVAILVVGCLGQTDRGSGAPAPDAFAEAIDFARDAPAFAAPITVMRTSGPSVPPPIVFSAAEASLAAAPDGTLFITIIGCDDGPLLTYLVALEQMTCQHAPVFRSRDDGATWTRLNPKPSGRLTPDGPAGANQDADVAVDAGGMVYATALGFMDGSFASNSGGVVPLWRSADNGDTWVFLDAPAGGDRPWLAAGKAGHVVQSWGRGGTVQVRATFDGGVSWSDIAEVGEGNSWHGPAQIDARGTRVYIPITMQLTDNDGQQGFGQNEFGIDVARSDDGGLTWSVVTTPAALFKPEFSRSSKGTIVAPSVGISGDGTILVAWSEETTDATRQAATGARIMATTSRDHGTTWSRPLQVSTRPQAVMPWVVAGDEARFAIAYYESAIPADVNTVGNWDVIASFAAAPWAEDAWTRVVVEEAVHPGGVCNFGPCGFVVNDGTLAQYFEAALLPDGRMAVSYTADPLEEGRFVEVRYAVQLRGLLLASK